MIACTFGVPSRFPSKPVLGDDYADHLNGPRVQRSEAKDAEGRVVARPPWKLVLN